MPSMTITTDNDQAARLAAAVGHVCMYTNGNGAPRSATAAEVKDYIIGHLRGITRQYEKGLLDAQNQPAPFEPT